MRLCWNGRQAWLRAMWGIPVRVRVSLAAPRYPLLRTFIPEFIIAPSISSKLLVDFNELYSNLDFENESIKNLNGGSYVVGSSSSSSVPLVYESVIKGYSNIN